VAVGKRRREAEEFHDDGDPVVTDRNEMPPQIRVRSGWATDGILKQSGARLGPACGQDQRTQGGGPRNGEARNPERTGISPVLAGTEFAAGMGGGRWGWTANLGCSDVLTRDRLSTANQRTLFPEPVASPGKSAP
jgi:hypothetical protein